jgi:hypothetical protein
MNYRSLPGNLEFLSVHLQNPEWSANSLLNLSKPTQENLLKYPQTSKKFFRGTLIVQTLALLPRITFRIFAGLLLSVITPWEWCKSPRKQTSKIDWLIVSNTSNLRSQNSVDSVMDFFATVIETKIAYLYLNAELTSTQGKKKFPKYESIENLFICPKTENPINTLRQSVKSIVAISEAILLLKKTTETTLQQKCLLMNVVLAQFSRQTMRNLLIGKEVLRISKELGTRYLIYSYEGNTHELSILSRLKSNSNSIEILPYQHAPIVTSQFGLQNEMQRFNDNTIILTSGLITKDYFQTLQKNLGLRLTILEAGSYKFNRETLNLQSVELESERCILFLPEADISSFLESLESMKNLAGDYEDLRFVIRKHPSLNLTKRLTRNIASSLPANCSLSSLSLDEDFKRSVICVFRSSAAAIEAARFGVYPVHIDFKGDFNMNPFDEKFFKGAIQKANSYGELRELIGPLFLESLNEPDEYKDRLRDFSGNYFSDPLNSDFREYLKNRQ